MSREQIVRDTAYAIWEAEGKPAGRDQEHWSIAEAQVAATLTPAPAKKKPATKTPAGGEAVAKPVKAPAKKKA